jgi:hypothetical protein
LRDPTRSKGIPSAVQQSTVERSRSTCAAYSARLSRRAQSHVYRGTVHCHGWDEGGSALDLIAAAHGLDIERTFRDVLRIGADLAGLEPVRGHYAPPRPRPRSTVPPARMVRPLEPVLFSTLAAELLERCPIGDGDVAQNIERRGVLEGARADAGLPWSPRETMVSCSPCSPPSLIEQGGLIRTCTFLGPSGRQATRPVKGGLVNGDRRGGAVEEGRLEGQTV